MNCNSNDGKIHGLSVSQDSEGKPTYFDPIEGKYQPLPDDFPWDKLHCYYAF